jgi:hypothetical protein
MSTESRIESSPLSSDLKSCMDDLRKLHALPPYNEIGNHCAGDGIFGAAIRKKYTRTTFRLAEARLGLYRV